jgi:hypothetical protein
MICAPLCIAAIDPSLELNGSTSALFSLDQYRLAALSPHMSFSPASLFPPRPGPHLHNHYLGKYRHFYQHRTPTTHHHQQSISNRNNNEIDQHHHPPPTLTRQLDDGIPASNTESHLSVDSRSLSTPMSVDGSAGSISTSHTSGSITVQVISSSSHAPELDSQLETPLMGPRPGSKQQQQHHHNNHHQQPPPQLPFIPNNNSPTSSNNNRAKSSDEWRPHTRTPQLQAPSAIQPQGKQPSIATISSIKTHHGGKSTTKQNVNFSAELQNLPICIYVG